MACTKRRSSEKAAIDRRCVEMVCTIAHTNASNTRRGGQQLGGPQGSVLQDAGGGTGHTFPPFGLSPPPPQARQAREAGINPAQRRRKPSDALGDGNTGVGERDRKDRLHVKVCHPQLPGQRSTHNTTPNSHPVNAPPRATPPSSARLPCTTAWQPATTTATTRGGTTSTFSTRRRRDKGTQHPRQSTTRAPGCHSALGEVAGRHQTPWAKRRTQPLVRGRVC